MSTPGNPSPHQQEQNPYGQRGFQQSPQQARQMGQKAFGFLRPADWAHSAIIAGTTYAGMALVAILFVAVLGAALGGDEEGLLRSSSSNGLGMLVGNVSGYMFFALVFQMVAMAWGGTLRLRFSMADNPYRDDDAFYATAHLMPLLLAVVGGLLLFFASRFVSRRNLSRGVRVRTRDVWVTSLITGLMLTVAVVALTMVFAGRATIRESGFEGKLHVWALSWHLFVYPWVFGTLISVWGRRSVMAPMPHRLSDLVHQGLPGFGLAGRLIGLYAGTLCAVCLLVVAIVSGAQHGAASFFAALFFGLFLVVDAFTLGHLGAMAWKSGQTGDMEGQYFYIWNDGITSVFTHWPMLVWIGVVLGILLVALAWAGRRPQLNNVGSWFVMPVVFLLAGLVAVWGGSVRMGGGSGSTWGSMVVGPAWWTPVVFLVWGVVVEVLARFLMPPLARSIPGGLGRFLVGSPVLLAFSPTHRYSGSPEAQQHDQTQQDNQAQQVSRAQYAAPAQREPMDPGTRKKLLVGGGILAGLVLLTALAFGGVAVANATVFDPQKTVEDYMDAVKDGKASQAVKDIDPNVPEDQRVLLTDDVYGSTDRRIDKYEVKDVEEHGDSATATVDVTQNGQTQPVTLKLKQSGGILGLHQWKIDPDQVKDGSTGLYRTLKVVAPEGVSSLTINGHDVKLPDTDLGPSPSASETADSFSGSSQDAESSGHEVDLTVLPGEYDVEAPQAGKYITYGDTQKALATVGDDQGPSDAISFDQKLTEAALTDAKKAADEKLDQCAAVKEFEVEDCGFDYSIGEEENYRNPNWSIVKKPEWTLSNESYGYEPVDTGDVNASEPVYLTSTKDGKAKLTYQRRWDKDDDWEDDDYDQTISGYFQVKFNGDKLELQDKENSSGF